MWVIWNGVTVAWSLEWYDKTTEEIAGELFLEGLTEEDMRPVLALDDKPFIGSYPIGQARADRLRKLVDIEIDLERYNYYLGPEDTGRTHPDPSINEDDFPENEVWYPAPDFCPRPLANSSRWRRRRQSMRNDMRGLSINW